MNVGSKRIGEILEEMHLITGDQLVIALKKQKETKKLLGQVLMDEGFVTEKQIIEVLEVQFGIPQIQLNTYNIDPEVPLLISLKMARRHMMIPVKLEQGVMSVAMSDPLNIVAIDDLKLATGFRIEPYLSSYRDVEIAIEQYYKKTSAQDAMNDFTNRFTNGQEEEEVDLETALKVNSAPVVKLIDSIIFQAAESNVSDIHIEPGDKDIRIRFRVDGDLQEHMTVQKASLSAIITRIKIMGYMNIAENRIPQDGRVELEIEGKQIDLRISIMPTVYGEKVVIRLLIRSDKVLTIEELGMSRYNVERFKKIIGVPNGIVLVTGPTGSGKTTSLYATLTALNDIKKNTITVEDPVEYRMAGINQTQTNDKAGLTFASCLRSILRQDPDIIMIGEIRDGETAQIAIRAAITGHLVLSTIHTNDTASTVARLVNMGSEAYLLSSSLTGIVAQRLVKKICTNCKTSYALDEIDARRLGVGMIQVYKGKGCNLCNHTGYRGRTAIYEILPVTRKIRALIDSGAGTEAIKDQGIQEGMTTLYKSCMELVLEGTTTIEELYRMTNHID